jgi:uncharacterized protein YwgA
MRETTPLTEDFFVEFMQTFNQGLKDEFASKSEMNAMQKHLETQVATKEDLKNLREALPTRAQIEKLQNSTDTYTKKTEDWKHEQDVLAAQTKQLKKTLIHKGIVSETELAV